MQDERDAAGIGCDLPEYLEGTSNLAEPGDVEFRPAWAMGLDRLKAPGQNRIV